MGAGSSYCLPEDERAMTLFNIATQVVGDSMHWQLGERLFESLHSPIVLVLMLV